MARRNGHPVLRYFKDLQTQPPSFMNSRFTRLARIPSFLPLASATLMLGVAMSFTAPYLSLFGIERIAMTPLKLGLFMTLIAASGVAASTWAGKWSDRHGRRRPLLVAALIASALGFVCLCRVRDYTLLLLIGVAFLGAGGSAISLIFSFGRAAIPARDEAERTFITATLRTLLSVAWVFGPPVGALVLAATGFSGLFLFAATSFTACAVIVARIKEPAERGRQGTAPLAGDAVSLMEMAALSELSMPIAVTQPPARATVPLRMIWRPVLALTLIGLAANATIIVLPLYMVLGLGGTRIEVSIMLGLGAFLEIPMMLVLGARGSMLNKQRWLAAAAAVHLLYFVAVAAAGHVWTLIPMQALSAFVVAVTSCLGMTYIQDLQPDSPGASTALFFNAARVGSILSGVLSGVLVGSIGYKGTFLACACLAGVAFWLFSKPLAGGGHGLQVEG